MKQEQARERKRRPKPEKVPMLGMAWVTNSDGQRRKAVIQKMTLEAKTATEVSVRVSGFMLHNPGERFDDAEVVGRFTPLGRLYKALANLFAEGDSRSKLDRAHNMRLIHDAMARHGEGMTFAHTA